MAIFVNVPGEAKPVPVPDFSYHPNESLAQLIVDAWVDKDYRDALLEREAGKATEGAARLARASLAQRGIYLERAVVISEKEYHDNYTAQDRKEVVLVLPNKDRVQPRSNQSLLETARLLMAATPNGI